MASRALQDLPGFIDFPLTDLAYLSDVDRCELEQCGGLTLPHPGLRDRILHGFADFVYPQMPIVNLHQVIAAIDGAYNERVSLLLFQAIMFAGVSYIPLEFLLDHNYRSHGDARRDLFRRLESCFYATAHAELADPVTLIQALLFMTLRYDPSDTQKDSHYWMGMIKALSDDIGMHSAPLPQPSRDSTTLRLWRRIAWTTYARDRTILLGARRPALIRAADFTLSPLSVADFELEPIQSNGPSCLSYDCTLFRDSRQLRDMAYLCVEQVRLAQCIDAVFTPQESLTPVSSTSSFAPALAASDAKLKAWWSRCLAQDMGIDKAPPTSLFAHHQSLVVQRLVLRLTFNTIISALHRPLVLRGTYQPNPALGFDLLGRCRQSLDYATQDITMLADYVFVHGLSLCIPASVVTSLLSALIVHMMLSRDPDHRIKSASLLGFEQCLLLLESLRSRHANADDVYHFLERAIRSASEDAESGSHERLELFDILEKVKRGDSFTKAGRTVPAMLEFDEAYTQLNEADLHGWPVEENTTASGFLPADDLDFLYVTGLDFEYNRGPTNLDYLVEG